MSAEEINRRVSELRLAADRARDEAVREEAKLVLLNLLQVADSVPSIKRLGFEADWEYDDEGSYKWYVRAVFSESATDDSDADLEDWEFLDDRDELRNLVEDLGKYEQPVWKYALDPDGEDEYQVLTVDQLRARAVEVGL